MESKWIKMAILIPFLDTETISMRIYPLDLSIGLSISLETISMRKLSME
jgi:hypothetical protein